MMREGKEIATWEHSRWIVGSSTFFMVPAFYAFYHRMYPYFLLLTLTSVISANYWRKATYSWRRNLDLIFAKISFVVFVVQGVLYVRTPLPMIFGYSGLVLLAGCYYLSGKGLEEGRNNWWMFHCMFHFIMMGEQWIILDSIPKLL